MLDGKAVSICYDEESARFAPSVRSVWHCDLAGMMRGRQSAVRLARSARSFSAVAQQPTSVSTLPNGMRVASESNGGETATVGPRVLTQALTQARTSQCAPRAQRRSPHTTSHVVVKKSSCKQRPETRREN